MKRFLIAVVLLATLRGQTPVTSITTQTTSIGQTTYNGTQFDGLNRAVMSVADAAGNNYSVTSTSTNVFLRRNTSEGNSNHTSVTFASAGGNEMLAPYATTAQSVLLGNNIYQTIDNVFTNGNLDNQGNIERIDYLFNNGAGITATAALSLAIFERGLVGIHDSFNIALITDWNFNTNTPVLFTNITTVTAINYGTTNVTVDGVGNFSYNYNLFRYGNGDNLTTWTDNTETNNQGIGGVMLNWLGLGAVAGQRIYGYSISANDTTTNPDRYGNWNNTSRFPSESSNGFDPYSMNGQIWGRIAPPIPEPATYGFVLMSGMLALLAVKRYRSAKA